MVFSFSVVIAARFCFFCFSRRETRTESAVASGRRSDTVRAHESGRESTGTPRTADDRLLLGGRENIELVAGTERENKAADGLRAEQFRDEQMQPRRAGSPRVRRDHCEWIYPDKHASRKSCRQKQVASGVCNTLNDNNEDSSYAASLKRTP